MLGKVYVDVKVRLMLSLEEDVDINKIITYMNYDISPGENQNMSVLTIEVREWRVLDHQ